MARQAQAQPTRIANLQRFGAVVFTQVDENGQPVGDKVEIRAGEEGSVPKVIWDRYKDRPDIKAADGITIAIGGFEAVDPGQLNSQASQRQYFAAATKQYNAERAELEKMRAELEARELQLREAMG